MEKIHVLSKNNSSMRDSTVGLSLVLTNRQYTVNGLYLKKNTCKNKVYIDQLIEMVAKAWQEPNSLFPQGAFFQYLLIQCSFRIYKDPKYYE